jgi:hypothetical protein
MRGRTFAQSGHPARPCFCLFVCLCVLPPPLCSCAAICSTLSVCLFVCLCVCLLSSFPFIAFYSVRRSVCVKFICPLVTLFIFILECSSRVFVHSYPFISISIYPSLCLCPFTYPDVHLSAFVCVFLDFIHLSIALFLCRFIYSHVHLCVCVCASLCMFIHFSISLYFFSFSFRMFISTLVRIFSH